MDELLKLAEDMGLTVIYRRGEHTGGYLPGDKTIRINPGMRDRIARSVLAHEIAHHILEHRPTNFGPVRHRQEKHANEWAACHLIDLDRYIEVEQLRDGHEDSMAHDLHVAPELLAVYRSMLLRIGDTVYLESRLGDGMWRERRVA